MLKSILSKNWVTLFIVMMIVFHHPQELRAEDGARTWCIDKGGEILHMMMLDQNRVPNGIEKEFCRFNLLSENISEGIKDISFDTLYTERETLAYRFFEKGCSFEQNISLFGTSPALTFCKNSGGIYSNWRNKNDQGDESGFCLFADGSMMSDWAICYGKEKLPYFSTLLRYQAK